ncbi:alpha/beta fold hydrolase [Phytohabitans aurantiacus]|uniref:AB hydrolase-1 domain-containing protein n=1 Tax=Phytohabitans aurantiacus TaxID=3016789 RepID=A0ABQ5R0Q3_9ACTN|nr:alpha/beta hydrolase [Phytohabitans aurantiacus]GLI00143.1 hypothetical protein Pa4123_54190 [Phytohabitans aurantiacus]
MSERRTALGYRDAPTRTVAAAGAVFAYRELGPQAGVPLVVLTHLGANLDNWDPRLVDGQAQERHAIAVDYRGVGDSTGRVRDSIEEMAAVVRALGYERVDVLGLSMGGMVAQAIVAQAPELMERLVLAGSGPAGGPGLTDMTGVTVTTVLRPDGSARERRRAGPPVSRRDGRGLPGLRPRRRLPAPPRVWRTRPALPAPITTATNLNERRH